MCNEQQVELMGGHLTVSSKEHCGSTFTFVLPYKVSPVCDSSDETDELSEVDRDDVSINMVDDDTACGFFQFQPRTLGSLFSSPGSARAQMLLPNGVGYNVIHNSSARFQDDYYSFSSDNNLIEERSSPGGDESSLLMAPPIEKSSESQSSQSYKRRCDCEDIYNVAESRSSRHTDQDDDGSFEINTPRCMDSSDSSRITNGGGAISGTTVSQPASRTELLLQTDRSSECSSSNSTSAEVTKSSLKPKILLVEDNKINVMVTKSMMKQLGHDIEVVNNGVEAVRAVQRSNYDLILMVSFT